MQKFGKLNVKKNIDMNYMIFINKNINITIWSKKMSEINGNKICKNKECEKVELIKESVL